MPDPTPKKIWSGHPPAQQRALLATYEAVAKALPGANQGIAWGMPAFRVGKDYLMCIAGFKNHNSLFPGGGVSTRLKNELKEYTVTKGTIHFDPEKPFPAPLLKKILKARIAEINESYPKASGAMAEYYDNGFMKLEGKLKDGKRNGTWKFYKRDGSLQKTVTYKNGVEVKK